MRDSREGALYQESNSRSGADAGCVQIGCVSRVEIGPAQGGCMLSSAHLKVSASTMPAPAMDLTMTADDNSCVNRTKEGAGTNVTHTCMRAS